MGVRELLAQRRRPEPALDVGLAAERTAMAWQRTGLAVAAFSTLLVRVADRDLALTVPGLLGLVLGLGLIVVGERRYSNIVERVQTDRTPLAHDLASILALGVTALSAASLIFVVTAQI
jgi:putative membrane protein